ncbi:hypothetical protein K469DRAFT_716748 [Zopfia rhizophila CBS 207.26]|uniref:Inositolphosphotransferase Aur1/Ipt1 domain-containing protein n=1 Tax=Zopfia rhizophila CBS 207.26 TaxID=1314779 RepID=A0A6A6EM62_9PEZI|nr:hypothetical protein K469DRAFT_716748 [Zopfia rhizophila CBS 207.26]
MGTFKNVIEPATIALIFTAGTLINRRKPRYNHLSLDSKDASLGSSRTSSPDSRQASWLPENSAFRHNLLSRFLAAFPFLLEIWYWLLTYWIYQLARAYSAHLIRHDDATWEWAERHALSILSLEKKFGLAIDLPLQHFILSHLPWLMPILAKIYYSHIAVGVVFIVYTYTFLPSPTFTRIRRTIAMNNLLAFIIFTSWRCSPPRLLPPEFGYIDILHPHPLIPSSTVPQESSDLPPSTWNNNRPQLTLAAMPSLHFGTSLFLAICLERFSPHRPLRVLAPLWPAAMVLTILATANHWVLDAVVGAVVPFLGWRLSWVFESKVFEVIEEWGFWVCRTEKPVIGDDDDARERSAGKEDGGWMA